MNKFLRPAVSRFNRNYLMFEGKLPQTSIGRIFKITPFLVVLLSFSFFVGFVCYESQQINGTTKIEVALNR